MEIQKSNTDIWERKRKKKKSHLRSRVHYFTILLESWTSTQLFLCLWQRGHVTFEGWAGKKLAYIKLQIITTEVSWRSILSGSSSTPSSVRAHTHTQGMLLVASGYNSLSWWPTPQNHAGWSPPPCQIFNKLTPCWNKPLHHIIMTNLRHGADAVRDTHPLSCLLYLTKSSSSSNLSELRNKILVTGLCSVSRWVITAKTFRGKKDRRRRLFISSPVPIHFTWKLRQKTGQPATKRRPKPIREWKKTSVKLSFISSRWSRMVVSHRLSTLLPGLPACFSLKQGVTHTHTQKRQHTTS